MNLKSIKSDVDGLLARLQNIRAEKSQAEDKVSKLGLMEVNVDNEISDKVRSAGVDLFNITVAERLPAVLKKSDTILAEMEDLIRQYVAKFQEFREAEIEKPILLRELNEIRDRYEIWPKEAPLPDMRAKLSFSIDRDGRSLGVVSTRTEFGPYLGAKSFLAGHAVKVIRKMAEAQKK